MSGFRDRVAKLLYNEVAETCGGYVESVPEDEQTAELLYYTTVDGPIDFGQLADAVIEKLRPTIATVEELEALPVGSMVRSRYGDALTRFKIGWHGTLHRPTRSCHTAVNERVSCSTARPADLAPGLGTAMSAWLNRFMEITDQFFADALPGWRALGVQRPPEFWVDQVHDAVGDWEGP